jgi:hypothetical protein
MSKIPADELVAEIGKRAEVAHHQLRRYSTESQAFYAAWNEAKGWAIARSIAATVLEDLK